MSESTTGTERVRRAPEQMAQDRLNDAEANVTKAEARLQKAKDAIGAAEQAVTRAKAVRDYAAKHPDLPAQPEGDDGEQTEGTNAAE